MPRSQVLHVKLAILQSIFWTGMIDLIGMVLALGLLMFLAYRGISILILSPLLALLALVFAGNIPLLATYTQVFMPAAGRFVVAYFPLFLLGALFGELMDRSGAAHAISDSIVKTLGAEKAILTVVLVCSVLTYGGVSLFVVAFASYPIAAMLFRQANIPKRLIPGAISLGAFSYTMSSMPGTPAIQNAIPMPYFNTTPFAAPGLGILASVIMFGLGMWWLNREAVRARKNREGYGLHSDVVSALVSDPDSIGTAKLNETNSTLRPALAWLPILLVIALNYLFGEWLLPAMDSAYLRDARYGSTTIDSVRGVWAIVASLSICSLLLLAFMWNQRRSWSAILDKGANSSLLPMFNTASLVGFGAVIASLPAFDIVKTGLDSLTGSNPLVSISVSVSLLAAITGSASGGMTIALDSMGAEYKALALANNISFDLLHRITTMATGGLDSLPHNGAVVTLLGICGLTHRDSYKDIFMVTVLFPVLALAVLVVMGSMGMDW